MQAHPASTPISKRNVPYFNPDGSFKTYIKRATAIEFVRIELADWRDETKHEVQARAEYAVPKGKLDIWEPRQSGKRGPLVLQLT